MHSVMQASQKMQSKNDCASSEGGRKDEAQSFVKHASAV